MTPFSASQDHVSELKLLPLNFMNVLSKVIDTIKSALIALMRMTLDMGEHKKPYPNMCNHIINIRPVQTVELTEPFLHPQPSR